MPYFVKVPYVDPAFPVKCPYCFKEAASKRIVVEKKEYKPLFDFKSEMDTHTVVLPMCSGCKAKKGFFKFLSVGSLVAFVALFIASFFYEPIKGLTMKDMAALFGVSLLITAAFALLRHIHLTRFKVVHLTKEHFTVETTKKEYAQLLAARNKTRAVKKLFLFKPLEE